MASSSSSSSAAAPGVRLVVASRLHWNQHSQDAPIDAAKALAQVLAFCARAGAYGDALVLALALPSPLAPPSVFADSVRAFAATLPAELARSSLNRPVRLVPLTFWGQFVPALNASIATAATAFPGATHILFQSLEIAVGEPGVAHLRRQFRDGCDLVVGAALPGHEFAPHASQPRALDGGSTPWNTLALWDLRQLAKIGFPLVGDGLALPAGAAGVEEVATIALYQQLFPATTRASVVQVPGLEWHVAELDDPERRAWQQRKMESKKARPAQQLAHLALPGGGEVYHLGAASS